jgi:ribonuclease-3
MNQIKMKKQKSQSQVEKLRKSFKTKDLFEQALTHRSWLNENPGKRESNERLEFLGDAVLEFVVSDTLYRRLPDKEEGFLTALRANIVNTQNLSKLASALGIGGNLYMSRGEEQGGGQNNHSLLANTIEAIIGATHIDRGFEAAAEFIETYLLSDLEKKLAEPLKDPKSRLQEAVQAQGLVAPEYRVIKESGPDHEKAFLVGVWIRGKEIAKGEGKSINQGEQNAASVALVKMGMDR